ncbi:MULTISPECIES: DUF2057 domain-containing protein [Shewanella]|nr:DUF2057 domain-containing protein [Shewanella psychromarinicola]MCL1082396.1 DUF2057 domain-containing protein [Shewanella psychromarinicola]
MRHIIMLLCLTCSQWSIAASLQLPDSTETVLVNGKASEQSSVKLDLTLPDGMQQIAFRYQAHYRDNGRQDNFISDVVILRFQAEEQTYQLTLPAINSASDAKQFNAQPALGLIDQTGKTMAFTQDKLMKSGLQIGRDFAQENAQYNDSDAIAAIAPNTAIIRRLATAAMAIASEQGTQVMSNSAVPLVKKPEDITQAEVSRMLDYWYQKANNHTQAEFKAKINQ